MQSGGNAPAQPYCVDMHLPVQAAHDTVKPGSGGQAVTAGTRSTAQPATHALVPQHLLAAVGTTTNVKNRPPHYEHILRSVYTRGVAKPRRRHVDSIPACACSSPCVAAQVQLSASRSGRQADQRRQSNRRKQLPEAVTEAVAQGAPAATTAALPACFTALPEAALDCDEVCDGLADLHHASSSDSAVEKAMGQVQHIIDCLSVEGLEGSSPRTACPPWTGGWANPSNGNERLQADPQHEAACGDACLNRQLNVLCDPAVCPCGQQCSNRYITPSNFYVLADSNTHLLYSEYRECVCPCIAATK